MDQISVRKAMESVFRVDSIMMPNTAVDWRILGSAWPRYFNKPIAETLYRNIKAVGLPRWSEADQTLTSRRYREKTPGTRHLSAPKISRLSI